MFIICDSTDVVQDIATEKANLSRGYTFPGFKLYENVKPGDIMIGDTYDGVKVTPNTAKRDEITQELQNESLIASKTRELAITALKTEGKLPPEF